MVRLFVAIRPPQVVRTRLLAMMGGVSGARWQSEEQFHLTLRFVGEVDRHQAADLDAALAGIVHPAFNIAIRGLGSFERRGVPTTLWAGVTPHEPLQALHKKIDEAAVRAGLPRERRAYFPHITLARLTRDAGPVGAFLEYAGAASTPVFRAEYFCLYESRLTPAGADYRILERYPLG